MEIEVGQLITKAKTKRCGDGEYPVLSMTMHDGLVFQNDRFKKQIASVDQSNYQVVSRHQLVESFPIDEGVLAVQELTDEGIVSPAYKIWDVDTEQIVPVYLEYALRAPRSIEYYKSKLRGTTARRRSITDAEFCAMTINCPSLDKQERILDILQKTKQLIHDRTRELELLDELIKARFVELFGDPKINEKNWDTGIVSQFYYVKGGKRIPKGMRYADGITAHPYLRATDMKNETILDDDIHYIDEAVFEKIKRYTVKGGDIYLTNVGVNLGMAGVIPDKYDGANLTENAVKLVPKTDVVLDGLFLAHYINSPGIQDYINERKMSVGVPKLAIFRIETMPLILPPMNLQIEFINFCKQVDKSKVAVQKSLDETQKLFDSLMQEYFG